MNKLKVGTKNLSMEEDQCISPNVYLYAKASYYMRKKKRESLGQNELLM